jgi:2-phospho-L-lactate guanylyltransferase
MADMRIVIPCKPFSYGKSRLAGTIDDAARRDLCERLLNHALEAARALIAAERVHVVTSDPDAVSVARRHGAQYLLEPSRGLNAALSFARDSLTGNAVPAVGMLVLPIDLIKAGASDFRAALESTRDVTIAPDRLHQGTNLLSLSPAAARVFRFAFGNDSFAAHGRIARELGLSVAIVDNPSLAFDLDLPEDYETWMRANGTGREAFRHRVDR